MEYSRLFENFKDCIILFLILEIIDKKHTAKFYIGSILYYILFIFKYIVYYSRECGYVEKSLKAIKKLCNSFINNKSNFQDINMAL